MIYFDQKSYSFTMDPVDDVRSLVTDPVYGAGNRFLNDNPVDITGEGEVILEDLEVMAWQWLGPPGDPSADIAPEPDGNGIVDFLDFALLAENWLEEF